MKEIIPSFQSKALSKSPSETDFKLYRAALEWNLVDPIVIESKDDFKSHQDWHDKLEPYHHQVTNLITFCRRLPVTLLADDVGLGKTISAGLIVSELVARNRINKILIVCPKILMPQWKEELDLKFGINAVEAIGRELVDVKLPNDSGAVITTYQSAQAYLNRIAESGYQMLILDEAHKLRNLYGTQTAPQVAIRFKKALKDRLFKYVLMLTATPIQNRLWDIYSLVDLLAVARGHENPFGGTGLFARKFIADNRTQARQLVAENKDEFRKIVYGYLYRTRRADVRLYFPQRKVQLHKVQPTADELRLIEVISEPIQKLNPLVQISLLQALVSSPQAFSSQLTTMARNKTVEADIAIEVKSIVDGMQSSSKLEGLKALVAELKKEQGDHWRMVIFTERIETQTTIEIFLSNLGISCGLINGGTGSANQQTIGLFKEDIPKINVIISTRAGSEGVNLQAANVLVNYDLPWNPMIVEQRIGRIQRLASNHKNVVIFNMILQGTFEEYIVGRLMEKLQMASHAIGDIEALLEAAGVDEEDGFEDKIRKLVIDSLAGKDVEKATRLAVESINKAKSVLKEEEESINSLLGSSSDVVEVGPRCPKLPHVVRSMEVEEFTISALNNMGATVSNDGHGRYFVRLGGKNELICFSNTDKSDGVVVCKSGTPFFERIVTHFVGNPLHHVDDTDTNLDNNLRTIISDWMVKFEGLYDGFKIERTQRCFDGTALLRVNITVTHDSYERLIEVKCLSEGEMLKGDNLTEAVEKYLNDPSTLGLPADYLKKKALDDDGVFEFCRFYLERLESEIKSAGDDFARKKRIEDDFTPRVDISLVGLEGKVFRNLQVVASYKIKGDYEYSSTLVVRPASKEILSGPEIKRCQSTNTNVPIDCLGKCEISGTLVLKHLLKKSELSDRCAMEEYFVRCSLTNKRILKDEVEKSDVTGSFVASVYLKTSTLSGRRAEPEHVGHCDFTGSLVLNNELAVSQVSGKKYRIDQESVSSVSGIRGHKQEFVVCSEKNIPLLLSEAEKCEVTGRIVSPGILEECEVSGKKVIPSELGRCSATGKKALKKYIVSSNISKALLLESVAIRSNAGNYCLPAEAKLCSWSLEQCHPEDVHPDHLTGLVMHSRFIDHGVAGCFKLLNDLLNCNFSGEDGKESWSSIVDKAVKVYGSGRYSVESASYSPNKERLAVCLEAKTWAGLMVRYLGLIYSIPDGAVIGNIVSGKRDKKIWIKK
jgi:superfamily II DNA or RNA helicase